MKDQHTKISGYRDLSQQEIDGMNLLKEVGETVRKALEAVEDMPGVDKRWLAIARTDLQKGFMSAVRAIAQPTTF